MTNRQVKRYNTSTGRVQRSPEGNLVSIIIETGQYSITLVVLVPRQGIYNCLHYTNNPRARQAVLTLMNDLSFFYTRRVLAPTKRNILGDR